MFGRNELLYGVIAILLMAGALLVPRYYEYYLLQRDAQLFVPKTAPSADKDTLRLALLVYELQNNPRFSLSAADLDQLDATIAALQNSVNEISTFYSNSAAQETVKTTLYPITFWQSLIKTEQLRRTLIAEPNQTRANEYFVALTKTLEQYEQFIDRQIGFYEQAPKDTIGYLDGKISRTNMIDWLAELKRASQDTTTWMATRRDCLDYYASRCQPDDVTVIAQIPSNTLGSIDNDRRALVTSFANRENASPATDPDGNDVAQVLPVRFSGQCSQSKETELAQLWWNQEVEVTYPYVRFAYIDEVLFYAHAGGEGPFSDLMNENNIPYQYQPINHYLCWQHGHDHADLTTQYAVWNWLQRNVIFDASSEHQSVATLEEDIRSSTTTIDAHTVTTYLNQATALLEAGELTPVHAAHVQNLSLLYRDKSAFVADSIASLIRTHDFTTLVFAFTNVADITDLLTAHSALALMTHSANQTIAPERTTPVQPYDANQKHPNIVSLQTLTASSSQPISDARQYISDTLRMRSPLEVTR